MTRHRQGDRSPQGPSQRSQRLLRVGEVVRHVLAEIFLRGELQDPELQGVNLIVSEVRVSPDMRHATVFVARLGGGEMETVMAVLLRARGFLRTRVGHALTTRFTPDLVFELDRSFDEADHIARLLRSEPIAHDLQPKEDPDGTPPEG
jgi:ribosome-binding factor A